MISDTRIELEALITEREGYIAENIHRQLSGNSVAYGADAFNDLADRMRALKEGSTMNDAELVEAALERQVSELTNKNCELQEKLDEYKNAYKFIMDDKCFNEEKHCACAPILRAKVKELEAENALLRKRLEPIEEVYANWYELDGEEPSVQICKDLMEAIKKCVELREAE